MADLRQIIRNVTILAPSSGSPSTEDRENPFPATIDPGLAQIRREGLVKL